MIMNNIFKILIIMIVFYSCEENVVDAIHGCFEVGSCNYNPEATYDNGTCDNITCADCLGVTNGEAQLDCVMFVREIIRIVIPIDFTLEILI